MYNKMPITHKLTLSSLVFLLLGCNDNPNKSISLEKEAVDFIELTEKKYAKSEDNLQYAWHNWHRFSTVDTKNNFSRFMEEFRHEVTESVYLSSGFIDAKLNDDMAFRFDRIRTRLSNPAPKSEIKAAELFDLTQSLHAQYNKPCGSEKSDESCLPLAVINKIIASSNDATKLQQVWQQRRENTVSMTQEFAKKIALSNIGTQRVGFQNTAEMRSARLYQMEPNEFIEQLDRVWSQVSPLYSSLQCHVRAKLGEKYGNDIVKPDMPIPAHLLKDVTASSFSNLYQDIMPTDVMTNRGYNLTEKLISANYSQVDLMRTADAFKTSMGFEPLQASFYSESVFKKPATYDVECESGLWWLREHDQSRLVRCLDITSKSFEVAHTELTQHLYWKGSGTQPRKYSGFPTGVISGAESAQRLLISPNYLKEIDLIDNVPDKSADLGYLMKLALDDVSSLPFYLLVDKWRWAAASNEISSQYYNNYWWQLRQHYQGIERPKLSNRESIDKDYFDPGTVAAVINNQDLSINAVTTILKYQIHKNLCEAAGDKNVPSRCSTYNSIVAGNKLRALYNMGNSMPWAKILARWSDEKQLDGTALVEYFAPLQNYLDEQNKERSCGW